MVRICIRLLQVPFELFKFTFECFESLLNGSNLHSNASNSFRKIRIYIQMFRIPFEWFKCGLKCSNLHSNASNLVQMLEFIFECLKSLSNLWNLHLNAPKPFCNRLNLHSNASSPFRMGRSYI